MTGRMGYVRRSSRKDKEEEISTSVQKGRIKEKAGVTDFYMDKGRTAFLEDKYINYDLDEKNFGVNYKLTPRPAFRDMLLDAQSGKLKELWVYQWDRFSRHTAFQINVIDFLNRCGVKVFATDDSNEDLVRNILSLLGQQESIKKSQKVNAFKRFKFMHGLYPHSARKLGYKWKTIWIEKKKYKFLIPRDDDHIEVQMVREIINSPQSKYKEICQKYGIHTQVYYNIRDDDFYRGYITFKGEKRQGRHDPLV